MQVFINHIKAARSIDAAFNLLSTRISNNEKIRDVVEFARKAHEGQYRKSGEPYIVHPILVATIVAYFGGDETMIISAILHDVVEDTPIGVDEIEKLFGKDVVTLVDGLTKIDKIREENLLPSDAIDEKLIKSAMTFRKMLVKSVADPRILVIKLCDRLHNILTLDALLPHKQKRIAEETLVVYAPIAHRLGISRLKNQLEDISFSYIFPTDYKKIESFVNDNQQKLHLKLNSFVSEVDNILYADNFQKDDFSISSRVKHFYSVYLKIQRKGISIDEVLDLLAVRILVKTEMDCYRVLGLLHTKYRPLISRFKDYIALPKENGYQTIHTTLFYDNNILEVQIRTFDMHKTAELGVAAHWKYKSGALTPKMKWLESMQYSSDTDLDFYEKATNDLYSEEISVYSPNGDAYTLPLGARALDFAYAIHTEVGDRAIGCMINKKVQPLLTKLKNGDLVKIDVGENQVLRCTWANMLKTSKAVSRIKLECKHREKEIDYLSGINILSTFLGVEHHNMLTWCKVQQLEDIIFKIPKDNSILDDFVSRYKKMRRSFFSSPINFYRKKGYKFDNILVYANSSINELSFDHCCHPKHGDPIVAIGYKKGKVIIHHKMCENGYKQIKKHVPMYKVKWATREVLLFNVVLTLDNRKGALAEFVTFLTKDGVNIISITMGTGKLDHLGCKALIELPAHSLDSSKLKIKKRFNVIELVANDDAYKE